MSKGKYFLSEERFFQEMQKNKLPHIYKKIGIGVLIVSVIGLIYLKFLVNGAGGIRLVFQQLSLAALLMVSVSKDKTEDEMTVSLRLRSYAIAVICGALYIIAQPLIAWIVTSGILQKEMIYQDLSSFQVLSFILLLQIGFYEVLKRKG